MTLPEADVLENGRPERRRRRPVLVAAVLTALAVVGAAATPAVVSASRSTPAPATSGTAAAAAPAAAPPAPDCPMSTVPAPDGSGEYGIYVKAEITDLVQNIGWSESLQFWQAFVTDFSAQACGVLHLPSLRVDIPKDKIVFDTSKANVGVRGTPDFYLYKPGDLLLGVTPTEDATNEITGVRPDGTLDLTATTTLHAELTKGNLIYPGPISCPIDLTTPLTTGTSYKKPDGRGDKGPVQAGVPGGKPWTLQGSPLDGPLQSATATIVGNTFEFPLFPNTPQCPLGAFSNGLFAGSDEAGETYCPNGVCTGPAPAGVAQITGKLRITGIDPGAIFTDGPPVTLPGTP